VGFWKPRCRKKGDHHRGQAWRVIGMCARCMVMHGWQDRRSEFALKKPEMCVRNAIRLDEPGKTEEWDAGQRRE
jgi:hypothetical protein